ncbi:hypothetical protein ACFWN2_02105 [Lentzea sp. NPDC058436]|uniref:hypothetical protein n=1 Tax=Lentzea sp. NPDC058436 TaxID=3346499 RepID=UPI0036614D04
MKLVEARSLSAAQLGRVREIYEDGFDPRLRAPFENLLTDRALVLVDDAPRGLAVLRDLGDTGWVFLRYFVVGERGRGLGERLWTSLRAALTGRTRIVFDVEDPAEHGITAEEELVRRRRITFYVRLGAVLLPANGYLPPHGNDAHPMLLMAADLDRPRTPPIAGEDLRQVTSAVYRHRYGLDHTHPVVARTLRLSGL